jgi:hypothetical protein
MFLTGTFASSGFGNVENQQPSRRQGGMDTAEKPAKLIKAVSFIEQVVETLAQRSHRNTSGQFRFQ